MSSWVAWGACGPESTTAHDRASRRETRIWRYPYPVPCSGLYCAEMRARAEAFVPHSGDLLDGVRGH